MATSTTTTTRATSEPAPTPTPTPAATPAAAPPAADAPPPAPPAGDTDATAAKDLEFSREGEAAARAAVERDAAASLAARAAELGQGMATPGGPVIGATSGAEAAAQAGEKTVKMNFPRAVSLTRSYSDPLIHFPAGINEVPESVKDHPYLLAAGAKPV